MLHVYQNSPLENCEIYQRLLSQPYFSFKKVTGGLEGFSLQAQNSKQV